MSLSPCVVRICVQLDSSQSLLVFVRSYSLPGPGLTDLLALSYSVLLTSLHHEY